MIVTVVAIVCHTLPGLPQLCHEEIVARQEMPMQACLISQAALADWKSKSKYRGDQWTIGRIKCVPGAYEPKDAI